MTITLTSSVIGEDGHRNAPSESREYRVLIGMQRAKPLVLTGKRIDARQAKQIGLINEGVPFDDVIPTAQAVGEDFTTPPPLRVRWTKRIFNNVAHEELACYQLEAAALEALTVLSTDHAEPVTAWLDKAPTPKFRGC